LAIKGLIKRLHAENFLSLKNVTVEFGKLTVLVGPNAAGKSNILKALKTACLIASESLRAIEGQIGLKIEQLGFGGSQKFALMLESEIMGKELVYNVEVHEGQVLKEELMIKKEGKLDTILKLDEKESPWYIDRSLQKVTPLRSLVDKYGLLHTVKDTVNDFGFTELAKHIRTYAFEPRVMKRVSEMPSSLTLDPSGSNLAGLLAHIKLVDKNLFSKIERTLQALLPEVQEIVIRPVGKDAFMLGLREKGFETVLTNISDGTLRLLAFITALNLGDPVVAFEEPENCVHPYLLETLVDLMRKSDCQVIITTHSPYLLNHIKPEEVVVVEKKDSKTLVKSIETGEEKERVKRMLEEGIPMGEIWYSGEIGGVP